MTTPDTKKPNSSTSNHNRTQRIVVEDSKQIASSLSQIISKNAYIFSMQNNQKFLQFMKLFNEDYTSLDIDDLRRNCFLGKTLASARFIHLAIDVKRDYDQQLLWFIVNAYSRVNNKVWHDVLFVAPCQLENALEHVCSRVLDVANAYNIIHKIKTVISDDEEFVSYFTKVKEVNINNWKILFYFKHTLMDIVNSAIHNSGTISLNIVTTKKLLHDIVDQENSTTTPIDERMNKDLDTLNFYLCKVSNFLTTLEPSRKIDLIVEVIDVLKDMQKAQGEIHMISEVLPKLFEMVIDVKKRKDSLQDATQLLCINLQTKLDDFLNNWEDITIYATATLLDPRFRTIKFVKNPDEWTKKILCQLIKNLKINLFNANMLDNTKETTLRDEFQRYIRDELIGRDVDPISWRDAEDYQLFPLLSSLGLDKTKEEITLRDEFQKYIKDEPIGMDFDPISWWDGKGCQLFPLLSTFAYEYLSIPVILTPISKHVPEQIWKIVQ